jgi:hypothetical protein
MSVGVLCIPHGLEKPTRRRARQASGVSGHESIVPGPDLHGISVLRTSRLRSCPAIKALPISDR